MIVIDASVAVKWFVNEDRHEAAAVILNGIEPLIAPDFVIYETMNVLRRNFKRSELGVERLGKATKSLPDFFDMLVSAPSLIDLTVDLCATLDHGIYDCAYLACALRYGTAMVTADARFARKAIDGGFHDSMLLL